MAVVRRFSGTNPWGLLVAGDLQWTPGDLCERDAYGTGQETCPDPGLRGALGPEAGLSWRGGPRVTLDAGLGGGLLAPDPYLVGFVPDAELLALGLLRLDLQQRAIGVAVGGLGAATVAGPLMVTVRIEHSWLLNGSRVAEVDAGVGCAVGARSIK